MIPKTLLYDNQLDSGRVNKKCLLSKSLIQPDYRIPLKVSQTIIVNKPVNLQHGMLSGWFKDSVKQVRKLQQLSSTQPDRQSCE